MDSPIPLDGFDTLDELLNRARTGKVAAGAMELIRDELAAIKQETFLKLLNAPENKLVEYRADLKAIENLARKLLARDAQGEMAMRQLMAKVPGVEKAPPVTGKRRSRAKDTTAKE